MRVSSWQDGSKNRYLKAFRRAIGILVVSAAVVAGGGPGCDTERAPEEAGAVARGALSTCSPPGATQVVVYHDTKFSGACTVLNVGDVYTNGVPGMPNGWFSSLWVGASVRARIGSGDFEGGYAASLVTVFGDIRVEPLNGHRFAAWYKGDYPRDRENFMTVSPSEGPQGLAHDGSNWYLTRTKAIFRVPLTADLAASNPSTYTIGLPDSRWSPGLQTVVTSQKWNHYGDPQVYGSYLFVPVESGDANLKPNLFVFRLSDMGLVRMLQLSQATKDSSYHSAFVAIDSQGVLYTANRNLGPTGPATGGLDRYAINLANIENLTVSPITNLPPMPVYDRDGTTLLSLQTMQGGVFASDDSILYLSASQGSNRGLWGVELNSARTSATARVASNIYGFFTYAINDSDFEEAEGMDYVDVTTFPASTNLPASQLHVLLFSNDPFGTPPFWLKHYSVRTAENIARSQAIAQPTTAIQNSTLGGAAASRAIDGDPDGNFWDGSVSHTDLSTNPYWRVDLGGVKNIDAFTIFNRTDCCGERLREWKISVSDDDSIYTEIFHDSTAAGVGIFTQIYPTMGLYNGANAGVLQAFPWTGRYVKMQINRPNEYLQLAEVVINGL